MGNTTSTKPTSEGTLPQRNPKTGRFEKTTVTHTATPKPVVAQSKTPATAKPATAKPKKS